MTQVKMPEPVAWLRSDELRKLGEPYSDKLLNQKTDSMRLSAKGTEKAAKQYGHNVAVITVDQAEAYAGARVREALEPGFNKCFALLSAWLRSTQAVADMGQVATLTSLVEFALTNQGKTSDQLEAEYHLPEPPTE